MGQGLTVEHGTGRTEWRALIMLQTCSVGCATLCRTGIHSAKVWRNVSMCMCVLGCVAQACGGNVERAADWLFSHTDDLDSAVASVMQAAAGGAAGGGNAGEARAPLLVAYALLGFIDPRSGSSRAPVVCTARVVCDTCLCLPMLFRSGLCSCEAWCLGDVS